MEQLELFDNKNKDDVLTVAENMFDIFEDNTDNLNGETLISTAGLSQLCGYFDYVDEDIRGAVWEVFLDMLYEADYIYNIEQFLIVARKPN